MNFKHYLLAPFNDINGLKKMLLGSVLLCVPVLNFYCFAYWGNCIKLGIEGGSGIPSWSNWSESFKRGAIIFFVVFIYFYFPLLMFALALAVRGPFGLISLISFVLLGIFLPYAVARLIDGQRFRYAFDLGSIFKTIVKTYKFYLPAYFLAVITVLLSVFITLNLPFLGLLGYFMSFYVIVSLSLAAGRWHRIAAND